MINISAVAARVPMPFLAALPASKAALSALSDALRLELAAWDIPVTVIEPGSTDTQIFAKADAAAREGLAAADPGRVAHYHNHLGAMGKAASRQKPGPADPVAHAVLTGMVGTDLGRHFPACRSPPCTRFLNPHATALHPWHSSQQSHRSRAAPTTTGSRPHSPQRPPTIWPPPGGSGISPNSSADPSAANDCSGVNCVATTCTLE